MRRTLRTSLAAVLLAGLLAAPALAAPDPAVVDCTTHNALTGHYTVAQLQHALATMPAEVREYTSCGDVIQRALDDALGGVHTGSGGGSGGGSFLPLPLIIVLVIVLLAGAVYGALGLRRRAAAEDVGEAGDEPPTQVHPD